MIRPLSVSFFLLIGAALPVLQAEPIDLIPGFKIEKVHEVAKTSEGSWVSLCVDGKGDLLACDQYGGIWRVVPPAIGSSEPAKVSKVEVNGGKAQGLLWAFDSLYFNGAPLEGGSKEKDPNRSLYCARDTKGTGQFDEVTKIVTLERQGEHGPHAIVLSPDGKQIYFAAGNHTPTPDFPKALLPKTWQEDQLLPRMWDANGHARGIMAPGGFIARCDPDGGNLEIVSGGYRNEYDFAFDGNGEIFTYDSDMEWDYGLPWYRPTRILHVPSGSEFGWRSGSGKWPEYYPDSLPALLNVGPGSPTGVVFGTGLKFPAKYQRAMFAMDWSFGTLYTVNFEPNGATYSGTKEVFLSGSALPLADLVVRPQDGALYFVTGGRGTASALYRVTYTGSESTAPAPVVPLTITQMLRRRLETHQHPNDPAAVAEAWPQLDSADRFIRYAARIAIEQQPTAEWQEKALAENRPHALREGILALARSGAAKELQPRMIERLLSQDFTKLANDEKLDWLRVCGLIFIRLGEPDPALAQQVIARLDEQFPGSDDMVNRELSRLLIYLGSPTVVAKAVDAMYSAKDAPEETFSKEHLARGGRYGETIALVQSIPSHKQQIFYAFSLRAAKTGWTPELLERYVGWFNTATTWYGGNSFVGYLRNARSEVIANVKDSLLNQRLVALTAPGVNLKAIPQAKGPGAAYTVADFQGLTLEQLKTRDVAHGREMFAAGLCVNCHHMGAEGGNGGPDLTGLGGRMTPTDALTAIIEPSKEVSDQYANTEFHLKDGTTLNGRVAREDAKKLYVMTALLAPESLTPVTKMEVQSQGISKISPMLPGLINGMNRDEVLDLLAYLLSPGGK